MRRTEIPARAGGTRGSAPCSAPPAPRTTELAPVGRARDCARCSAPPTPRKAEPAPVGEARRSPAPRTTELAPVGRARDCARCSAPPALRKAEPAPVGEARRSPPRTAWGSPPRPPPSRRGGSGGRCRQSRNSYDTERWRRHGTGLRRRGGKRRVLRPIGSWSSWGHAGLAKAEKHITGWKQLLGQGQLVARAPPCNGRAGRQERLAALVVERGLPSRRRRQAVARPPSTCLGGP